MRPTGRVAISRDGVVGGRANYRDPEIFMLEGRSPSGAYVCTATLIAPRLLLTAAHCVEPENGVLPTIYATNVTNPDLAGAREWVRAVQIFTHPDYDTSLPIGERAADIAAVSLEHDGWGPIKPFNVEPIDNLSRQQKPVRVTGYGITVSGGNDEGLKRWASTTIGDVLPLKFGLGTVKQGTCQGDSGGPALYTFPDGVERAIGVVSYGKSTICGIGSFDTRIDTYEPAITEWITIAQTGACTADGRCNAACAADPDCQCKEDGVCNAACTGRAADPDCPSSCNSNGVCSRADCTYADVDCAAFGARCGRATDCNGRLCITSPQAELPYCTRACSATTAACPAGYDCTNGRCEVKVLPVVAAEAPCTPGQSYCGGPEYVCAPSISESVNRCRHQCYETPDCDPGSTCSVTRADLKAGVCVPDVVLPRLSEEENPGAKEGCTAAPGGLSLVAALALLLRRRRA